MIKFIENNNYILFTIVNVNFHACKNGNWCYQKGTKGQYTRCGSVSSDGLTCYNPEIRYGSTIGGKPGAMGPWYQYSTEWCRQLFPTANIIRGTAKHTVSYLVFLLLKLRHVESSIF